METERLKLKNLKDLEYNGLLNNQNIVLVLLGTLLISFSLTEVTYLGMPKTEILVALATLGVLLILYFKKRLHRIMQDIRDL